MGIDLPDWGEIIALVKGDKETFKSALSDMWRSMGEWADDQGDSLLDKIIGMVSEHGGEALVEARWPNCPDYLKPIAYRIANWITHFLIDLLERYKGD